MSIKTRLEGLEGAQAAATQLGLADRLAIARARADRGEPPTLPSPAELEARGDRWSLRLARALRRGAAQ